MKPKPLILAGIGNSGPEHWQTFWQAEEPRFEKLEHSEWDKPDFAVWVRELEAPTNFRETYANDEFVAGYIGF